LDSNDYGPISTALVVGRAVFRVWPWERIGRIPAVSDGDRNFPKTRVVQGKAVLPADWEER